MMRYTRFLRKEDIESVQYDAVPHDLRVYLTRVLDKKITPEEDLEPTKIVYQNRIINKSRMLSGLPAYALEGDDECYFPPTEHARHGSDFQMVFLRLSTVQFIEFVGELVEEGWFEDDEINQLLEDSNLSFWYRKRSRGVEVVVDPIDKIAVKEHEKQHDNIRVLLKRMEDALASNDHAGVLHASASVFETLAKHIVPLASVQNQTLKGFFDRYRKDSKLPDSILDYMLKVYEERNVTPLAGHGSTKTPKISREQAVVLCEMTRAFVRIEYQLYSTP